MIKHFLRISFRQLGRNRVYSFINIAGLTVGLAGFVIVLLYLNYELSYDKWDSRMERVYKISERTDGEIMEQTAAPLAQFLKQELPAVEAATRVQPAGSFEVPLSAGEQKLYAKGSIEVDSLFFQVFPYRIIAGDKLNPLAKPNAMVITPALSRMLFGDADPIGKTVKIFNILENEVTAVMEEPSGPSHLNVQFAWRSVNERSNMHWNNLSYQTYVRTREVMPVSKLDALINPVYYDKRLKNDNKSYHDFRASGHEAGLFADAAQNIHNFPRHGESNFTTVTVLLVLAFLLLIAGAINFSNLSIAASIRRAKEMGIRKTLGSGRGQLIAQFLGETALQCVISMMAALVLVQLILPYFNDSFGVSLSLGNTAQLWTILWQLMLCLLVVVLLSGLYPAIVLSLVNTSRVLKGEYSSGKKGNRFRNALIVLQFVVAGFFVFGTLVISRQISFMENSDKGFDGNQVVRIQAMQRTRDQNFDVARAQLLAVPGVVEVAKSTEVPGDAYADTSSYPFRYAGESYRLSSVKVSTPFFNTLGIKLQQGRLFDERSSDQQTRSAVINQSAARLLGQDVVGKTIYFDNCDTVPIQVIGVVNDFHVMGFESAVKPVAYTIGNFACMFQSGGGILVKIRQQNAAATIAGLETAWKKIEPDLPLRYSFLDDNFQKLLASHIRLQRVIGIFAITAIVISIMGLFAITAYFTGQRRKEIGVRKVLGAGVLDIASLLSKDFVLLVLTGVAVAIPLGYWASSRWLQTFAYRIPLGWQLFALSALLVLLIAVVTITLQTVKAARANPVKSLRQE